VALAMDTKVRQNRPMFVTDLSYVRAQLRRLTAAELHDTAKKNKVNVKTLRRIASKTTRGPRSDTIGKLLVHFRAKESKAGGT
jgi:hypothetical protein